MTGWVIVTGSAGGIGGSICRHLRAVGTKVAGIDRSSESPADLHVQYDLADWTGLAEVLDELCRGREIVGLVNNAAHQPVIALEELDDAAIEESLLVNMAAPTVAMRSLRGALAQTAGAVVNVASVHAHATTRGMMVYAATKAGLVGLTRGAALELAPLGVRVNAVTPGAVDAGFLHANLEAQGIQRKRGIEAIGSAIPLGRVADPDEIARVVAFLLDGAQSSFVTGTEIVIDGGASARLSTD